MGYDGGGGGGTGGGSSPSGRFRNLPTCMFGTQKGLLQYRTCFAYGDSIGRHLFILHDLRAMLTTENECFSTELPLRALCMMILYLRTHLLTLSIENVCLSIEPASYMMVILCFRTRFLYRITRRNLVCMVYDGAILWNSFSEGPGFTVECLGLRVEDVGSDHVFQIVELLVAVCEV